VLSTVAKEADGVYTQRSRDAKMEILVWWFVGALSGKTAIVSKKK